jgi:hypothetical protein
VLQWEKCPTSDLERTSLEQSGLEDILEVETLGINNTGMVPLQALTNVFVQIMGKNIWLSKIMFFRKYVVQNIIQNYLIYSRCWTMKIPFFTPKHCLAHSNVFPMFYTKSLNNVCSVPALAPAFYFSLIEKDVATLLFEPNTRAWCHCLVHDRYLAKYLVGETGLCEIMK